MLLALAFVISIVTLFCSNAGFPFHYDSINPTPKQLSILSAKRTFLDANGDIFKMDGIYKIDRYDVENGKHMWSKHLMDAVPEYRNTHIISQTECSTMIGCGYPYGSLGQSWIISDSMPFIPEEYQVNLTIVSFKKGDDGHNFTMEMNGPNEIELKVFPSPGVHIQKSGPSFFSYGQRLLKVSRESISLSSQKFCLLISGWQEEEDLMEAAIAGRSWDYALKHGDSDFVDKHPQWVTPYTYAVDYKYYYF